MPYCGTNCLILIKRYGAPAGAAANVQNQYLTQYLTQNCQNCQNQFNYEPNVLCPLCDECAQPGSISYTYHHRHCGGAS